MLKFCPYCGAKILNHDVKFCMGCGKSLAEFMGATNSDTSIEQELKKCRESAEEGYRLASGNYDAIKNAIIEENRKLSSASAEQVKFSRIKSTELVDKQKEELRRLTDSVSRIQADINALHERQKDFSIVVYGRTMAGKSTLMEILTRGNGESIGKGAQRTTLDVRDYYWNGLKITDVPGISAFGGKKDEELAMAAAKAADLILFLLTDDAPQADEAEKLAQLKKLGKPILGLINVKMAFNMSRRALSLKQLQKKLADTDKLNAIVQQFKDHAARYDQDWRGIRFVKTHLLAAYQAHPCRDNDAEIFDASNFAEVEAFILDKVRNDGRFLRIKTFADSVAVPMSNIILTIYGHSGGALVESCIWLEKQYDLWTWGKEFSERSHKKLDDLYNELSATLKSEIQTFANNHYEDEKINQTWPEHVKGLGLDTCYQNLLRQLAEECERKRKSVSDELRQEMKYTFSSNTKTNIELEGTTAWGEYGSALIGGIGGVGGFIASRAIGIAFPPLGIALAAVSLLGWIFSDSKEEKIRKAKKKLREDLTTPSFDMLNKMHNQVVETFDKDILGKGVDEFVALLGDYAHMLARLGNSQTYMARKLFGEFSNLNAKLLEEAIAYKGAGFISSVDSIARIPGKSMVAFADRSNLNTAELSDLLGENISVMRAEGKARDIVKKVLGCEITMTGYPLDYDTDDAKAERAVAVFPKSKVDVTKFQIAQQIAGVPIITETKPATVNVQSNNAFESDFKQIDAMFANCASNYDIRTKLMFIRRKAENQRDAAAMNRLVNYYKEIGEYIQAEECSVFARKFSR